MADPALPRPLTRQRLPLFVGLLGIGVGQALSAVGFAQLIQRGFDTFTSPSAQLSLDVRGLGLLTLGFVLCVLASAWFRGAERAHSERLGQNYVTQVRADLFDHLTSVPARELGSRNRGDMVMKFVGDLSALRLWVARGLARLTVAAVAICLALIALAVMNVALALAVGIILVVGAVGTWFITPRLLRTAKQSRRLRSRLTGEVVERLTQVAVVQAAGQEAREQRRIGRRSAKMGAAMVDQARASGMTRAIAEGTGVAAVAAVVLVGGLQISDGRTTPGTVVAAVSIASLLAGYLRDLGRIAEYAARARVARAAARRFLAIPTLPVTPDATELKVTAGRVEVDSLSVGSALREVSATVNPGELVAIVGPNGAGKSTLVAAIARLLDPDSGAVRIDGQDLRQHTLGSARAVIGIASPAMPLLSGSMRRNVTYRLPRVDEEELTRVSALCELERLAANLPSGWDTKVGPGGSLLSSGQQGRIAIARAVLGRPPVLILDEAEAHLDEATGAIVGRVLADHSGTALLVTHRRELIERADRVWHLVDGELVADTTATEYFAAAELAGATP